MVVGSRLRRHGALSRAVPPGLSVSIALLGVRRW